MYFFIRKRFRSDTVFYRVWHKNVSPLAQQFLCLTLQKTVFWFLPFHIQTQFWENIAIVSVTWIISFHEFFKSVLLYTLPYCHLFCLFIYYRCLLSKHITWKHYTTRINMLGICHGSDTYITFLYSLKVKKLSQIQI